MSDPEAASHRAGGALGREAILARLSGDQPLVSGYLSLEDQLQPNGFDLSVAQVSELTGPGALGRTNADRVVPDARPLGFDGDDWLELTPGMYQVLFNEIVALPNDLMALGRPRSSLCRCGATLGTAVWDAGYTGRSTSLLVVTNPAGLRLARDARVLQLVFFTLDTPTAEGYSGVYQGENVAFHRKG
jgi:dUTP pyrophosphatase